MAVASMANPTQPSPIAKWHHELYIIKSPNRPTRTICKIRISRGSQRQMDLDLDDRADRIVVRHVAGVLEPTHLDR